jgi:hypothetical protein
MQCTNQFPDECTHDQRLSEYISKRILRTQLKPQCLSISKRISECSAQYEPVFRTQCGSQLLS